MADSAHSVACWDIMTFIPIMAQYLKENEQVGRCPSASLEVEMSPFTHLPLLVEGCICSFLSNDDLVSNASTTKLLRERVLESLSKRKAEPRRLGVVECERIGPYIGKVTISVEAKTEPALDDLMRAVGHLGALESLVIGEESSVLAGGKQPCKDWVWLSVATRALRDARDRLPRLQEVWLRAHLGGKYVAFLVGPAGTPLSQMSVPEPSIQVLHEFLCALPPGVAKLQLGPALDFPWRTCGLSSAAFVSILKLLESDVLPHLTSFIARIEFDVAVHDAVVSLLRHAPFAAGLESLQLGEALYKGPKDLSALVGALAHCPKLKHFVVGRGSGEAKHYFALMDLIISGQLPEYAHFPLPMELPVKLRTYEEMDRAVSLILEALRAGRFRDSRCILLGDDAAHVALPDATFDRLLTGTTPEVLPCLRGACFRCVPGPALGRVGDWLAQHKAMRSFLLYCGGPKRGGTAEGHLLRLLERLIEDPAMERFERVELVWVNQLSEATASRRREEEGKPCCLLKGMQKLVRKARRLPPTHDVVELSVLSIRDVLPDDAEKAQALLPTRQMDEEGCELEHDRFCRAREPVRVVVNLMRKKEAALLWSRQDSPGPEFPLPNPSLPHRGKWLHGGENKAKMVMDQRCALSASGKYTRMAMGTIMAGVKLSEALASMH